MLISPVRRAARLGGLVATEVVGDAAQLDPVGLPVLLKLGQLHVLSGSTRPA